MNGAEDWQMPPKNVRLSLHIQLQSKPVAGTASSAAVAAAASKTTVTAPMAPFRTSKESYADSDTKLTKATMPSALTAASSSAASHKDYKAPLLRPASTQQMLNQRAKAENATDHGVREGELMSDLALSRIVNLVVYGRLKNEAKHFAGCEIHAFYPMHVMTVINNLERCTRKVKRLQSKDAVLMWPVNIQLAFDTSIKHNHNVCIQNAGLTICPWERGNHYVALVVDSRQYVVDYMFGRDPHNRYDGVIMYWDPLGFGLTDQRLKAALKATYPRMRMVEVNERLQDDGIHCPIWVAFYFCCYMSFIKLPPVNPKRLCSVINQNPAGSFRKLAPNSFGHNFNHEFIAKRGAEFAHLLNTTSDDDTSLLYD